MKTPSNQLLKPQLTNYLWFSKTAQENTLLSIKEDAPDHPAILYYCYNDDMKHVGLIFVSFLAMMDVFFAPLTAEAEVGEAPITNDTITYVLTTNNEGRSILTTTESVTLSKATTSAVTRTIATTYGGHPLHTAINQVSDMSGKAVAYTSHTGQGGLTVEIRPTHPLQTFSLTYTQHDVTIYSSSSKDHEFAWDIDSGGWQAPLSHVSIAVTVADNIAQTLNGQTTCQVGNNTCSVTKTGRTFTMWTDNLQAGENVSFSIGFTAGTFRAYEPSFGDIVTQWMPTLIGAGVVALALVIVLSNARLRRQKNGAAGRPSKTKL